jgi:hypothetical protein
MGLRPRDVILQTRTPRAPRSKGLAREEMLIELDTWGFIDDPE